MKITKANAELLESLVTKYQHMLGVRVRPVVKVVARLTDSRLGTCTWYSTMPQTTTVEIQSKVFQDPRTLERVVAHEMVHHENCVARAKERLEQIANGTRQPLPQHGPEWHAGAALINAKMGAGFVTEGSDKEYVLKNLKTFFMVIMPYVIRGKQTIVYAWAAKLSPAAKAEVAKSFRLGGKLIQTTDDSWTTGGKIGSTKIGWSMPATSERELLLKKLYDKG